MSEIKYEIESKVKPICELREKFQDCLKSYLANGIEQADAKEVGEVADVIKDLAEAEESVVKAIYHKQITEAMEEAEYGEDYDENGAYKKYYTPSPYRMSRTRMYGGDEYYRDQDRGGRHTMYYTDPHMPDSRMGRSGSSRVRYFDTKSMHTSASDTDIKAKKDAMNEYFETLKDDIKEMTKDESSEMKSIARQHLNSIASAMM